MASTVYKLVPYPDTVLILKNPTTRFAVWEQEGAPVSSADQAQHDTDDEINELLNAVTVSSLAELPEQDQPGETICDVDRGSDAESDKSFGNSPTLTSTASAADCNEGDDDDPNTFRLAVFEQHSVVLPSGFPHYLVSSEHLKLSSSTFADMITKENKLDGAGRYYVVLEDCDEEALHILLNILHLKNRQVPREVGLEMLAKIAVLADRYNCVEAVEVFIDVWEDVTLGTHPVPSQYCRELILWLYVTQVFHMSQTFYEVTATAIEYGFDGRLRTMGLPIPTTISDEINRRRWASLRLVSELLQDRLSALRDPNYTCSLRKESSFQCSSILLGTLMKKMDAAGFSSDFERPYPGVSIHEAKHKITKFKAVKWCDPSVSEKYHSCTLVKRLGKTKAWLVEGSQGLELGRFEE
ncbi:hypothetical protein BDW02DRAFT_599140 [Decorospora gaudefroyi]|uniref:BTB domain-containing protein n=1 Tax=Decorospora gaudefroyi TaxID=184978 RepID=A0A6A5KIS8_9PLEO|nr:hypothetical protein BDW02DRAFT_599140 [Decorospora gaudefroyi]